MCFEKILNIKERTPVLLGNHRDLNKRRDASNSGLYLGIQGSSEIKLQRKGKATVTYLACRISQFETKRQREAHPGCVTKGSTPTFFLRASLFSSSLRAAADRTYKLASLLLKRLYQCAIYKINHPPCKYYLNQCASLPVRNRDSGRGCGLSLIWWANRANFFKLNFPTKADISTVHTYILPYGFVLFYLPLFG